MGARQAGPERRNLLGMESSGRPIVHLFVQSVGYQIAPGKSGSGFAGGGAERAIATTSGCAGRATVSRAEAGNSPPVRAIASTRSA